MASKDGTGFGDGVGGHQFGAEGRGAGEVVDVNLEEVLEGLVREMALGGGLLEETQVVIEEVHEVGASGVVGGAVAIRGGAVIWAYGRGA